MTNTLRALVPSSVLSEAGVSWAFPSHQHPKALLAGRCVAGLGMQTEVAPGDHWGWVEVLTGKHQYPKGLGKVTDLPGRDKENVPDL